MAKKKETGLARRDVPQLSLLAELEEAGAITEVSLTLTKDIGYDRWEALGALFGRIKRTTSWLIGDWLIYGEATFGEKMAQAVEWTGLSEGTLRNYMSVCGRIPATRRLVGIPFSMHADVAPLTPSEQTEWLKKAQRNGWSRQQLRDAMKEAGVGQTPTHEPAFGAKRAAVPEELQDIVEQISHQADGPEDGKFKVPVEPIVRLRAWLGEEE